MLKKVLIVVGLLASVFLVYLYVQAIQSQKLEVAGDLSIYAPANDVTTIAFGSCNRETEPQDYWSTIGKHDPDAWLWLGDNIYADTDDMDRMAAAYATVTEDPAYADFVKQVPRIYGTWDDHDYGRNDAGREWTAKEGAKELMLDFLGVPATAPVRQREGVYQAYDIDAIRVILLDTRSFRDSLAPPAAGSEDRYGRNATGDVLGEAQWAWLRAQLTDSPARAHLIGSSIQVLPTEHGFEKWDNFPAARQRLLALLAETRPALPLLLSGDRHLAEFSGDTASNFPVYEVTSSGLTHAVTRSSERNSRRIGPLVTERNYGLLHFVTAPDSSLRVLAEIRSLEDGEVRASHSLPPAGPNKAELSALVYPKDAMTRQLKPCPESPNCVSTQTDQPKKKREPIAFTGSPAAALEKLKRVVGNMPRTSLVEEDGNYLHYTFKTWPIPYIDDVEFLLSPEEGVIHYRSASRVGHSDLGVNSRRMAKVVDAYLEQ